MKYEYFFLYKQFPKHYVWNRPSKFWTKQNARKVIDRVNAANPSKGKRYYLRLLYLIIIKGSNL